MYHPYITRYFYKIVRGITNPRWYITFHSWWRLQWKYFPRYWPFVRGIHRSPVNSPHKGQWRGALIFSLICAWTKGWVNNRYTPSSSYVTVMCHQSIESVGVCWLVLLVLLSLPSLRELFNFSGFFFSLFSSRNCFCFLDLSLRGLILSTEALWIASSYFVNRIITRQTGLFMLLRGERGWFVLGVKSRKYWHFLPLGWFVVISVWVGSPRFKYL